MQNGAAPRFGDLWAEIQGAPAMAAHVTQATLLPTRSKKIRSHGTSSTAFSIPTI